MKIINRWGADMIVEMNSENIIDINNTNDTFTIFGKIIPEFKNNCWSISEELFDKPCDYEYSIRDEDYSDFIENNDKIVYLYYSENNCIGQIVISKYWNKNAYIQDICVKKNYRNKNVGKKLIDQAIKWTKEKNLNGIMLETQDVNITACRFYEKCGFILGGVDTMLYSNFTNADQKALFWYYKIEKTVKEEEYN